MKIVLDTNVLISALLVKEGNPGKIVKQIDNKKYTLLLTKEILIEAVNVLHRPHIRRRYPITDKDIMTYLLQLRLNSKIVISRLTVKVVKDDPEDNKFLALAKQERADVIVSGDPHLTRLKNFSGIPILTPAEFLLVLRQAGD